LREMLALHQPALLEKAINMALAGNGSMLKLLLDRLLPGKPKDDPVPNLEGLINQPLGEQASTIANALGRGTLSPSEAKNLLETLKTKVYITEISEMEEKLKVLLQEPTNGNDDPLQNKTVKIYIPENGRNDNNSLTIT
jgi:hypothetical protein